MVTPRFKSTWHSLAAIVAKPVVSILSQCAAFIMKIVALNFACGPLHLRDRVLNESGYAYHMIVLGLP